MKVSTVLSVPLLYTCIFLLCISNSTARKGGGGRPGGSSGRPGGSSGRPGGSSGKPGGGSGSNNRPGTGQQHTYPPSNGWSGTNYRPPQQIQHGGNSFPVSQTPPPAYVYSIRDSGSRYNNFLTGLALWNLGRRPTNSYQGTAGETCYFRIENNTITETTRIECRIISSFIWDWENGSNGTAGSNGTVGGSASVGNSTVVVSDKDTFNSTAVVDALEDKGEPILAAPGMVCSVGRTLRGTTTVQRVDCQLLQLYTANSWGSNSAGRLTPALLILLFQVILFKIF